MIIYIFYGVLASIVFFTVGMILREIRKYNSSSVRFQENSTLNKDQKESFIEITSELHLDADDVDAKNHLSAMKYKLEMFKIRNQFYQS